MVCAVLTVLSFTSWQLGGGRLLQPGLRTVFICLSVPPEPGRPGAAAGMDCVWPAVAASALAGIALIRAVWTVVVALQLGHCRRDGRPDGAKLRTVYHDRLHVDCHPAGS